MFDSLARFFNSQVTAHVGYTISITAILAAFVLMLLSSIVMNPSWTVEWKIVGAAIAGILVTLLLW